MSLRIIFAGTPEFAVPCLRAAAARGEVVAVYTQPDRPAGRGRLAHASAVKVAALELGLPVYQPENFKSAEALEILQSHQADLMLVVAYGLILPMAVLNTPRLGCWNVHASLLPRWRGAAPIQRALEAGDEKSGVCLMQMEKGLDTGPLLLQMHMPIAANETGGSLHDKLSHLGAEVLSDGRIKFTFGNKGSTETGGMDLGIKMGSISVKVVFPGDLVEVSPEFTKVNGKTITLNVALDENVDAYAISEAGNDSKSGDKIVIIIVGAIIVASVLAGQVRKRAKNSGDDIV